MSFSKRCFNIFFSLTSLIGLFPFLLVVSILIKISSRGPVLHVSDRVGQNNRNFKMYKFRTMTLDAPNVATHLMKNPHRYLTLIGKFLRTWSIDELPQILNVLKGDMNLVGPRPALYNQYDLIAHRTELGIHRLVPGITGFAQITGRDRVSIKRKVKLDAYYLKNQSLWLDLKIIMKTFLNVFIQKDISH